MTEYNIRIGERQRVLVVAALEIALLNTSKEEGGHAEIRLMHDMFSDLPADEAKMPGAIHDMSEEGEG